MSQSTGALACLACNKPLKEQSSSRNKNGIQSISVLSTAFDEEMALLSVRVQNEKNDKINNLLLQKSFHDFHRANLLNNNNNNSNNWEGNGNGEGNNGPVPGVNYPKNYSVPSTPQFPSRKIVLNLLSAISGDTLNSVEINNKNNGNNNNSSNIGHSNSSNNGNNYGNNNYNENVIYNSNSYSYDSKNDNDSNVVHYNINNNNNNNNNNSNKNG